MDRIISHQVVLANGTIATTSATQNADLFWALRGAGASYGIITAYTVKTFAAPPSNVLFSFRFDLDVADATSTFLAYQQFGATNCPAAMVMQIHMGRGSKLGRVVLKPAGAFMGSLQEYNKAIAPLLKLSSANQTDQSARHGIRLGSQFGDLWCGQLVEHDGCHRQRVFGVPMPPYFTFFVYGELQIDL